MLYQGLLCDRLVFPVPTGLAVKLLLRLKVEEGIFWPRRTPLASLCDEESALNLVSESDRECKGHTVQIIQIIFAWIRSCLLRGRRLLVLLVGHVCSWLGH